MTEYHELPSDLPVPEDDGAADHLPGMRLDGTPLAELAEGTLVAFVYPRTGTPGEPLPPGWDDIPGARGCTPQSCAFRDLHGELSELGATVVGVSAMDPGEQAAFAERERLPYPLLNDRELRLADTLGLPTFEAGGMRLYKRLTLVARAGEIVKAFYPVFPPERNAADVVDYLAAA
ncbi:MAG TPA: peroxiredoxin [Thermoleophilaceae bacterium]|jgi:peroxiredoxin